MIQLIAITCLIQQPSLPDVIEDRRTVWYDVESLPEVMVGRTGLFPLGYNIAGTLDKTGAANNEHPWRHTGGLDGCGPDVTVKRLLWLPPGSKIKVRRIRNRRLGDKYAGTYPVGTVSGELMYDTGRLFEIRTRRKTADGWETDQHEYGPKPRGYVAVSNCVDCHSDIGRHSLEINSRRDWYTYVRGLESGGPIHFHPWDTRGLGYVGIPVRIRPDVKSFVEWER